VTRAAVIGGNDIEDSLTRDEADSAVLAASDAEIARAEARLKMLEEKLSSFQFLEATLHSRFPDIKAARSCIYPAFDCSVLRSGTCEELSAPAVLGATV
jgi:hypothetical protein